MSADYEGLVLVGDEAYTPEEWERLERSRAAQRRYRARHPERVADYNRRYKAAHREEIAAKRRADRARLPHVRIVASLHSLGCTGPTRDTGCRCRKIKVYDLP